MRKAPIEQCHLGEGQSIKRITDIDELKSIFRREILAQSGVDIFVSQDSIPRSLEKKVGELENLIQTIKERIIWGVYGSKGELLEIIDGNYDVKRLEGHDALALQRLYTEGLDKEPAFFGSTLEIERAKTIPQVKKYIEDNFVMGIKQPCIGADGKKIEKLVAMGSIQKGTGSQSHIAKAGLLYVDPVHRVRGLAEKIFEYGMRKILEGRAEELKGIEQVRIVVVSTNKFAIDYYKKLGFEQYHYEANAVKRDGVYYDWIYMGLDLTRVRQKMREDAARKEKEVSPKTLSGKKRRRKR
jgi:ribosomal protein S18 acetylase RimI-like enzyme